MKFLTGILFIWFSCFSEAGINNFGHIIKKNQKRNSEYTRVSENGKFFIKYKNLSLPGNSFFKAKDKIITLLTLEDGMPVVLNIFSETGEKLFSKRYNNMINLTFSENKDFAVFSTGLNTTTLSLNNLKEQYYENSIIFSITDNGIPVFVNKNNCLKYNSLNLITKYHIRKIIITNKQIYIFTSRSIYLLTDKLIFIKDFEGNFFDAQVIDNELYYSDRIKTGNKYNFKLYKKEAGRSEFVQVSENNTIKPPSHEDIPAPLVYPENRAVVGNSYAEYQNYYNCPYLHPGVDFLGDPYQEVYSVHDGYVKAILTTGEDPYWRIAIANEDTDENCEGYLYAHLNKESFAFTVGDTVKQGDFLGTLYDWIIPEFTHIHFARISCSGITWNGDWWTTDDPLQDYNELIDEAAPVIAEIEDGQLYAFMNEEKQYLNPDSLYGNFDIIIKCFDYCNSEWAIDIAKIEYSLSPENNPDSIIYHKESHSYDMPLDVYISNNFSTMVLNTIYSADEKYQSKGDYDYREFYHIITNTDDIFGFTPEDSLQSFESTEIPNGKYNLNVKVYDAAGNSASATMKININNRKIGINENTDISENLAVYPNPFNPVTMINYSVGVPLAGIRGNRKVSPEGYSVPGIPTRGLPVQLSIYNSAGQLVKTLIDKKQKAGKYSVKFDGSNLDSGVYFCKLTTPDKTITNRLLLLK